MNVNILQDSLKVAKETLVQDSNVAESNANWWFWIAIAEFGLILALLFLNWHSQKNQGRSKFKRAAVNQEVDFNNIINSSFNSEAIYNELKVKCHPDRFPTDEKKNAIAENISQEISKNKTNVKRLMELKAEAVTKLNIQS